MQSSFDLIIVGAGSAGCVLANRLSADPGRRVLLIEAGPAERSFWMRLPVGYFRSMHDPRRTWQFEVEPQDSTADRRMVWPRGKVLGGSSAINGLLYIRGQHQDFDDWAQAAADPGWSHAAVLPVFRKSERYQGPASEYHGTLGELGVSDLRNDHVACEAWLQAAVQAGHRRIQDFNAAEQEGVGPYQLSIGERWRSDTGSCFLDPVRSRPNLTVMTETQVLKVNIQHGRAVGVRVLHQGTTKDIACDGEVVLAAGALQSPQILQLSGIGPSPLLREHGIDVVHDAPDVGENLQDHYQARVIVHLKERISLNNQVRNPVELARMGLQWALQGRGPLTVGAGQVGGLAATAHATNGRADILFNVMPLSVDKPGDPLHRFSGFSASAAQCRPLSRGHVRIGSADPLAAPRIRANYLQEDHDTRTLVAGLKMLRDIVAQPAFARLSAGLEYMPGNTLKSDADLTRFARERGGTVFHPSGTCRMGADDRAVVDARLRVKGIEKLRVIDASIMPAMVSTNTNAATIMIGEKGAAMMLEDLQA
ncbi:MAG: hypothetical protein RLZ51_2256 [Pseudomonadota bacterium]